MSSAYVGFGLRGLPFRVGFGVGALTFPNSLSWFSA